MEMWHSNKYGFWNYSIICNQNGQIIEEKRYTDFDNNVKEKYNYILDRTFTLKLVKGLINRFNLLAFLDKGKVNNLHKYLSKVKESQQKIIEFFTHLEIISICIPTILRQLQEDPKLSTLSVLELAGENP